MTTFKLDKMDKEEQEKFLEFMREIAEDSSRIIVALDHYGNFKAPTKKRGYFVLGEVQVARNCFPDLKDFVLEDYKMMTIIYKKKGK